jgi:hypothetical protein
MKMQSAHFDYMRTAIKGLDTPALRAAYKDAGLSLKRYQWDIARAVKLTPFICDSLYSYLNDDHIQTALNRIVPEL